MERSRKPEILMQKEIGEFLDYVDGVNDNITSELDKMDKHEDDLDIDNDYSEEEE